MGVYCNAFTKGKKMLSNRSDFFFWGGGRKDRHQWTESLVVSQHTTAWSTHLDRVLTSSYLLGLMRVLYLWHNLYLSMYRYNVIYLPLPYFTTRVLISHCTDKKLCAKYCNLPLDRTKIIYSFLPSPIQKFHLPVYRQVTCNCRINLYQSKTLIWDYLRQWPQTNFNSWHTKQDRKIATSFQEEISLH